MLTASGKRYTTASMSTENEKSAGWILNKTKYNNPPSLQEISKQQDNVRLNERSET